VGLFVKDLLKKSPIGGGELKPLSPIGGRAKRDLYRGKKRKRPPTHIWKTEKPLRGGTGHLTIRGWEEDQDRVGKRRVSFTCPKFIPKRASETENGGRGNK